MRRVTLGFKAFDAHELLCDALARRLGLYRDEGVDVSLVDTSAAPPGSPERVWVACGSALLRALAGAPVRVVLVACRAPMFWLVGRDAGALAGVVVAYPPSP